MMPLLLLPLVLLWDFDRTVDQTDFLVIMESIAGITGSQKLLVAGMAAGVCTNVPTGDADTFCTTLACPGPGTFQVTIQAIRYNTRSETVHLRVLDLACTRVEGARQGTGSLAGVPAATHCRPPATRAIPPIKVPVPAMQTISVEIPRPHDVAPIIPVNPDVIPKTPHLLGEVPLPTLPQTAQVPLPTTSMPPPLTVTLPTGPPTTATVPQPPVIMSGVACP
jgi:hypothetical protein